MITNRLSLQVALEHPRLTVGVATSTHAVLTLTGHGGATDAVRPRMTVVFVLDVSGSMSGEPLTQVKDSVDRLCRLLPATDRVGIVAFSSNPVVVAPVDEMDAAQLATIRRRLAGLSANGGTGMSAGVQAGLDALPPRAPDERQLLILLTDGAPTDGSTGDSLGDIVSARREDVAVVTLGYGANHNADLLDKVARAGRGQYWYIADPAEANMEFARALGAQADIVVDGVELVLKPADGVEIVSTLDGGKPRFSADGLILTRPDLRPDQHHTTIVALKVDAFKETGRWPLVEVCARYRVVGAAARHDVTAALHVDIVHGASSVDDGAARKVALGLAEIARARARSEADAGRFDAAAAVLKPVVARLEALPGYVKLDASDVSEAVEQLIDEIVAYESRPSAHQYLEFKSAQMAVDIAQGGVHAADVKMRSVASKAILAGVQGAGGFQVTITERGGATRVEHHDAAELTIGRVQGNEIVLPSGSISKRHTRVVLRDGKAIAVCLKSTNGTYVNGQRITSPRVLCPDDRVSIGDFTMTFVPVLKP